MEDPKVLILGSVVAGVFSTVLGHPLDTVKTHLQTNPQLSDSAEAFRKLRFRVFRGMAPSLANAFVMNSVMFSVFDAVERRVNNPFVAGIVSGFATAFVSTPTDCLKIRMQLSPQQNPTVSSVLFPNRRLDFTMLRKLYRGFTLNLGREGIFTMVYLGIYHWVMANYNHNHSNNHNNNNNGREDSSRGNGMDDNSSGAFENLLFVAGTSALTGATAWVASYPFDVAKTIVQKGGTHRDVRALLHRGNAFHRFYRGCLPSTGRAMLVTSSRMVAYDHVLRRFAENE